MSAGTLDSSTPRRMRNRDSACGSSTSATSTSPSMRIYVRASTRERSMSHEHVRRAQRRPLRVPLTVLVMRKGHKQGVAYATNVSCGGMCLQTDRPATPGDRVRLRFRLGPDCAEMAVEAEVVWCIEATGGTRFCQVGLHFLDLRDEQRSEIAAFVTPPAAQKPPSSVRPLRGPGTDFIAT